jgi:hypothetical protein
MSNQKTSKRERIQFAGLQPHCCKAEYRMLAWELDNYGIIRGTVTLIILAAPGLETVLNLRREFSPKTVQLKK